MENLPEIIIIKKIKNSSSASDPRDYDYSFLLLLFFFFFLVTRGFVNRLSHYNTDLQAGALKLRGPPDQSFADANKMRRLMYMYELEPFFF